MNSQPPKWAIKLLHFYCKPSKLEVIEGDLFELFDIRQIESNSVKARRKFIWDVIRFFKWRNVKGLEDIHSLTTIAMFRNYFKVSVRSLLRHKFYSFINILGLTIGMTCCMFILMFVNHEMSYDQFWKDSERIFRVTLNKTGPYTPAQLVKQMKTDYPEVEQGSRISGPYVATVNIGEKTIRQEGGFIADSTLFDVFDIKFLYGNPKTALKEPNTVVITRSLAMKYFSGKDALDKILIADGISTKITGIIEDAPKNSHIKYEFITSIPREEWATKGNWTGNNFYSYLKLNKNTNHKDLESKFPDFVRKYVGPAIIGFTGHDNFDDFLAEGKSFDYNLIPIGDIHLYHPRLSMGNPGKIMNVYIFTIVAFFILIIACINFMNLSTARSATRSKEVGIRKVLGSIRSQLVSQFMIESVLISGISLLFSIMLSVLLLSQFNNISGKSFEIVEILEFKNIVWLMMMGIVSGLLAGSYPALYLSKIQPILALRGILKAGESGEFLRKGLVSFQFGISVLLIISTLIVYTQINYMTTKDLGLNSKETLIIKGANKVTKNKDFFQNFLRSLPEVEAVCLSTSYPSGVFSDWSYSTIEDIPLRMNPYNAFVEPSYLDVLGVELVAGRFFNSSIASDTAAVVVNESFVKDTNWDDAIGQQLSRGGDSRFKIIGVAKDFHFHSMRTKIRPLLMRFDPNQMENSGETYFIVNVSGNYQKVLDKIDVEWQKIAANDPFNYVFLDDSFNNLYEAERKFGQLFTLFSVLAIFIGSLGMLALAAFVIEKRIKEIAIRKVMGASIFQITYLLIKDFTKLVILGGVIALPIAYILGGHWLDNFQYQVNPSAFIYLAPILMVIFISWITVGYQTIMTAKSNPATVLQNE